MKPADLLIESFCDRTELAPYCHRQTSTAGTLLPQTDQTAGTLLPSESDSWHLTAIQIDQIASTLLLLDSWHLTATEAGNYTATEPDN